MNAAEPQSQISGPAVDGSQCTEASAGCTIQLDALQGGPGAAQTPGATFQIASNDASRIFFTDRQQLTPDAGSSPLGGDLYEYDLARPAGERLVDLTPETGGEAAGVLGAVLGASEDGGYVYFVADGALAPGAAPGDCIPGDNQPSAGQSCNLYVRHGGSITFIAALSGLDQPSWAGKGLTLSELTARVSPDGRWLAFMSQRSLTDYDNRDAVSGQPDEEVYLYHAGQGKLLCPSCNPTGARPHGVRYGFEEGDKNGQNQPLAGGAGVWLPSTWLAANIPGWTPYENGTALHQSRYLSDSGRLFFNSSDALLPADTNGAEDVYQWEPPGSAEGAAASDTCTATSATFDPASEGCVDLITSGESGLESAFLDASESGDDVFFITSARLSPRDLDTSRDLYDARVGGGEPQIVKPVECTGDACQQPATPPNDPTPGSLTFNGAGNVGEPAKCRSGFVKKHGRCVKKKTKKHHKKKHKRANSNHGGGK
jgi:hypothetical protein